MRYALTMIAISACLLVPAVANAQTGVALGVSPWYEGEQFELTHTSMFLDDGDVESPGSNFSLQRFDTQGRYRLDPSSERDFRFGFEHHYLDIDTNHPALPTRLVDVSGAVAFEIGNWKDWQVSTVLGGGYAGDNPFGDGRSYYADVALLMQKRINKDWSQQIAVTFDQNRSIFPDIPLPSFSFIYTGRPDMIVRLGLPVNAINWQIVPGLTLEAQSVFFFSGSAKLTYELTETIDIFGSIQSGTEAFRLDDAPDNRRLFFKQRTAELGVGWEPHEQVQLELAGGYAFDQEFTSGFDVRSDGNTIETSDEAYIRVGFRFDF